MFLITTTYLFSLFYSVSMTLSSHQFIPVQHSATILSPPAYTSYSGYHFCPPTHILLVDHQVFGYLAFSRIHIHISSSQAIRPFIICVFPYTPMSTSPRHRPPGLLLPGFVTYSPLHTLIYPASLVSHDLLTARLQLISLKLFPESKAAWHEGNLHLASQ